ncbi:MAG TPA: hypothetical protein VH540_15760 [Ktedonobacterales bacterium]
MKLAELQIVNPDPKYSRAALIEPTTLGYIHIAAEVHPRSAPFMPNSSEKSKLLAQLNTIGRQLEQLDTVEKVSVFDALAFAPPSTYAKERADSIGLPRFDIVVLIEAKSPAIARNVQKTPEFQTLIDVLERKARKMHVIVARNAKRIADVDKTGKGIFLFNYFIGDNTSTTLELWDYLAGWYTAETGLDNSTLLVPLEGERSDYLAINNARWDGSLLGLFLGQFSKKSFRTYMLANLEANHVGAMPVLYRLADAPRPPTAPMFAWVVGAGLAALGAGYALRGIAPRWSKKKARPFGRARADYVLRGIAPRKLKATIKRRK